MRSFMLREATIGLFDVDDQAKLQAAFGAGAVETMVLDDVAVELIADHLEIEPEIAEWAARRYVEGRFRRKSEGLGGDLLGSFGEIIAYVIKRAAGIDIERVDGAAARKKTKKEPESFPEPDFVVRDRRGIGVLEIKSREALDFRDLAEVAGSASRHTWRWLRPCNQTLDCRDAALRQLGFENGRPVKYSHKLKLVSGTMIPFPAAFGEGDAILVRDGRVDELTDSPRLKTPPSCLKADPNRACWDCIGRTKDDLQLVAVHMPNRPDRLPLLPITDRELGSVWFDAYRDWSRALWLSAPALVETKAHALAAATKGWLTALENDPHQVAVRVARHWAWTIEVAARERGFALLRRVDTGLDSGLSDLPPPNEPHTERLKGDSAVDRIRDALHADRLARFAFEDGDDATVTSVLVMDALGMQLSVVPAVSPASAAIDGDGASQIANKLLQKARKIFGVPPRPYRPDLHEVSAALGERVVTLGWAMDSFEGWDTMHSWFHHVPPRMRWAFRHSPCCGRLWVHPDGRGRLRFGRIPRICR